MRIVGQIEHPFIKITILQMNERFAIKLEDNLLEQTYKFNEDDKLRTFQHMEKMVDQTFLEECIKRFIDMNRSRGETYQRNVL